MDEIKISDLEYVSYSAFTPNDLYVVVNYDTPSGETKNTKLTDLVTYLNNSISPGTNTYVTGFTYLNNIFTIFDNSGNTFTATIDSVTGWTVNGDLNVTGNTTSNGLTANTISASTYQNLPIDPDTYVTGFTYSNNTFVIKQNNGQSDLSQTINSVTGWTVNGNLDVSGKTKTNTFQMTNGAVVNYALISDTFGNASWQQLTPTLIATNRVGIANSNGVYTYYSDIQTAINAAVAGQTVELFADISSGTNVSINLKNGVNINGNGHSYFYSNSLGNCFQDNGVSVTCQILNLTISRTSSLSSGANVLLTGNSRIDFTGSYIYRNILTDNYACIEIQGAARVFNAYCLNEYGRGIWSTNANSLIENCFGQTIQNSGYGIMSHGNVIKSTGISVGLPGIDISSTNGLAIQCIGVSVSSIGIRGNTINCTGISTSGPGIGAQTVTTHRNSSAISSSSGAFSTGSSSGSCHNCTFETTSGSFGASSDGGQYHNCSISVLSGTGNGIVSPNRVVNCTVRVSSNSAFCLYSITNRTVNYASNVWIGTTTPISTVTITQGTTNVEDNQGNILM